MGNQSMLGLALAYYPYSNVIKSNLSAILDVLGKTAADRISLVKAINLDEKDPLLVEPIIHPLLKT